MLLTENCCNRACLQEPEDYDIRGDWTHPTLHLPYANTFKGHLTQIRKEHLRKHLCGLH